MKILMLSRATLFSHPGGDTTQIKKTAFYLNKFNGVEVDIKTINDTIDFSKYDLLHFFNLSRPSDFLAIISKTKIPYVVSTIFIDYSEAEKNHYKKCRALISRILNPFQLEYIKTLGRIFKKQDVLTDKKYIFRGQKKSIFSVLKEAQMLLPNSHSEYERIKGVFNIEKPYKVIPNAVDIDKFDQKQPINNEYDIYEDSVISVGQITPVKNHLALIKALNNTKYKVFIIGSPSSNATKYFKKCCKIASNNITFIPRVSQKELIRIYQKAKVHVLPSWFETTGLVSLEAGYMGCNIVITDRGDQKEYFVNEAFYCDPTSPQSILEAVDKAYQANEPINLKKRIKDNFNWSITAQKTLEAYKEVLTKN